MIERSDKKRNQAEVVKSLLKDPTQTEREVAKDVGLSNGTAHNHISELKQNGAKSEIMDRVLQMDDEIMDLSNKITLTKLIKEAPKKQDGTIDVDKLSLQDIKIIGDLANNSTKRKAIFGKKDEGDKEVTFIIS